MASVAVLGGEESLAACVISRLQQDTAGRACGRSLEHGSTDTLVYLPRPGGRQRPGPDLGDAEAVFQRCSSLPIRKAVVVSSAAVYGPNHNHQGLLPEARILATGNSHPIAARWARLEALAEGFLARRNGAVLTVLRPAPVLVEGGADYFCRLFGNPLALALPGHDPTLQLLSPEDLAQAIGCALDRSPGGVYNVAPDGAIPLRAGLRLAGATRIPIPRLAQAAVRTVLAPLGLAFAREQLDYIRYSFTVSNRKIKQELGFAPQKSSAQVLRPAEGSSWVFDDFGMDEKYIRAYGRTVIHFLHRYYWRIEAEGLHHIPRQGRAVLVGVHRGFMPWDGVMSLHVVVKGAGRIPRFLIHPCLVKFPFLSNFMTKLGGIIACQENADYVLQREELLGMYPEGIRGAFTMYREAYRLGKFGRDEFVRMALRNRAPLVPFVTVGNAEIFPILARIDWGWWKRWTEWPFFPIAPPWPLAPVPLPSKWHTQFLAPLHIEDCYRPEDADDPAIVRAISQEVRERMQTAIERLLDRRKSIFFGSIFKEEAS
jgi:1-acyl-sn-glycerol-3-phosphate acyltransferase